MKQKSSQNEILAQQFQEYLNSLNKDELVVGLSFMEPYKILHDKLEKRVCEVCGEKEVLPYCCSASVLSGANNFWASCKNCGALSTFKDHDYYLKVKELITNHQAQVIRKPVPSYKIENYETLDEDFSGDETCLVSIGKNSYSYNTKDLPKLICPICNQEEVIPYSCTGHKISKEHIIKGVCKNCNEHFAFTQNSYFCLLLNQIKDELSD